jgi:hypothetical protein
LLPFKEVIKKTKEEKPVTSRTKQIILELMDNSKISSHLTASLAMLLVDSV